MEELHRELDAAIDRVRASFGRSYPLMIGGREVRAASEFEDRSPIDTRILLGTFQQASREQARDAIAAAKAAYPAWSARPWTERVALLKKVADGIRARRWELSALMGYEAGKNRLECVGDVEESADLIEYYCNQIEQHGGFATTLGTLGPNEDNSSVLRPYGVWAVISPFNFPLALAAGPAGGALVAGNTAVFKPASATPLLGYALYEVMARSRHSGRRLQLHHRRRQHGRPGAHRARRRGRHRVHGVERRRDAPDSRQRDAARAAPADHRDGRQEPGARHAVGRPRQGQRRRHAIGVRRAGPEMLGLLARLPHEADPRGVRAAARREDEEDQASATRSNRDVYMGPVINEDAVKTFERAVAQARRDGGTILTGGRRLTDGEFAHGHFVEPTIIDGLPTTHPLFSEELFVPITVLGDVTSLDEAIDLANSTEYGLTAGVFSEDDREIQRFFDRIQAGVTYVNRRAGATTGAWPGINSFGGWKASGSTGRGTGGPYYVQQFMREQSRVRIR